MKPKNKVKAKIGLVYSTRDLAGKGIAKHVVELLGLREGGILAGNSYYIGDDVVLAGFNEDVIFFDFLYDYLDVEYYIVLSRHSSRAKVKSLTVHHPGNPTNSAEAGGRPRELSVAFPPMAKKLITLLDKYASEENLKGEYDVTLEVTHHGPTSLSKPIVFIEIGSSPEEWSDERAQRLIARVVVDSITNNLPECIPSTGFGGGHYARKHTKVMLTTNYCLGHIFSKHVIDLIDEEIVLQAIKRSVPQSTSVVIEKKGVRSAQRKMIKEVAGKLGLSIVEV